VKRADRRESDKLQRRGNQAAVRHRRREELASAYEIECLASPSPSNDLSPIGTAAEFFLRYLNVSKYRTEIYKMQVVV